MQRTVMCDGEPCGEINWTADRFGVTVSVSCALPEDPCRLFRCYGDHFLLGVMEPQDGKLHLQRHISRETLKQAGLDNIVPSQFYLSDGKAKLLTGDSVLDQLEVVAKKTPEGLRLSCPFDQRKPFLLAPAFAICSVEKKQGGELIASLLWKKPSE